MRKIKLLNVIGARPQIIKSSAISRVIRKSFSDKFEELILHTGQHYDHNMSQVFFGEMEIAPPAVNLESGSASHGAQTAKIIEGCENYMISEKPQGVIIYGDTNSTLAAALAASKLHIPIIHIEAGLRSFNKLMPEEVNRIVADHLSTLLFAPTDTAIKNLHNEGINHTDKATYSANNPGVFHCGDIMYDNALYFRDIAVVKKSGFLTEAGLKEKRFLLATIHRDLNTDNTERLASIIEAILEITKGTGLLAAMPLHPRTLKILASDHQTLFKRLKNSPDIVLLEPVSYLEMIILESASEMIITDSGGVQKESHFYGKPCIVLRNETEWTELVDNGTALLADATKERILKAFHHLTDKNVSRTYPPFYGDGNASQTIMEEIAKLLD